jgi:hypothetical protein
LPIFSTNEKLAGSDKSPSTVGREVRKMAESKKGNRRTKRGNGELGESDGVSIEGGKEADSNANSGGSEKGPSMGRLKLSDLRFSFCPKELS